MTPTYDPSTNTPACPATHLDGLALAHPCVVPVRKLGIMYPILSSQSSNPLLYKHTLLYIDTPQPKHPPLLRTFSGLPLRRRASLAALSRRAMLPKSVDMACGLSAPITCAAMRGAWDEVVNIDGVPLVRAAHVDLPSPAPTSFLPQVTLPPSRKPSRLRTSSVIYTPPHPTTPPHIKSDPNHHTCPTLGSHLECVPGHAYQLTVTHAHRGRVVATSCKQWPGRDRAGGSTQGSCSHSKRDPCSHIVVTHMHIAVVSWQPPAAMIDG